MRKRLLSLLLLCPLFITAKDYIDINDGWRFKGATVTDGQSTTLDDSSWEQVTLPHSWNALDGQDGGNDYRRGDGWYRRQVVIPQSAKGQRVYLDVGAACMQTWIYVNGRQVGTHVGGYARFVTDITDRVTAGQEATIAIRVNNEDVVAPPRSADFTFSGGIQRGVRLIVCNPLHLAPTNHIAKNGFLTQDQGADIASPGVRIRQTDVSEQSAKVDVTVRTKNMGNKSTNETVVVRIIDRDGRVVTQGETVAAIDAGKDSDVTQTLTVENPHLWNGLKDPYLYRVEVELRQGKRITDSTVQPLGLRYYSVDKEKGFFLNGQSYPLRGFSMHEELIDKGRALSDADRLRDLEIMRHSGLNYLRLSHYQHSDYTYSYCDSVGIIVYAEIPTINYMSDAGAPLQVYQHNAVSQLYELIRQQYNHPCIMFWGLCNEIRASKTDVDIVPVLKALNDLAHSEDPTRLTTLAHDKADDDYITTRYKEWELPDVIAVNKYVGWYEGSRNNIDGDFESRMTKVHQLCKLPVGMSEYGAGGSPFQHQYPNPDTGGNGSGNHPEEFQNKSHERHVSVINRTPWFWGTSLWAAFDFASDGRNEGDQAGINDKGVVTHDRAVTKDAYHLYRANFTKDEGVVYICSRRFSLRESSVPVAIYSNCPVVALRVNGRTYATVKSPDTPLFTTTGNVQLKDGVNVVEASALFNGKEVTDHAVWYVGVAKNTVTPQSGSFNAPVSGTYTVRCTPSGKTWNIYLTEGQNTITTTEDATIYFYHDGQPYLYDAPIGRLIPIPDNPNLPYNHPRSKKTKVRKR